MRLFTLGFTRKDARSFFTLLRDSDVARVIDIRLRARSQLSGFARADDLEFLLEELCRIPYAAEPLLAPTPELLAAFRKGSLSWAAYERRYLELIAGRRVERRLDRAVLDGACLLCSEHEPRFCHRRLAAEYLARTWGGVEIVHLL
jgi:uncharacterized protein (DUF488 family)